ncbi:retropepsin-like aspartic protease family protein [Pseudoduganella violaceinigra]|uniref:retropepsin-like aspartic protease family protein n=1 Tax=Pseudoduganella violaceinigra TaxID=246602 RepID=UPI00040F6C83|nr:retropepsin-like aspartic protease [Pseudoduganella violaceinigra]
MRTALVAALFLAAASAQADVSLVGTLKEKALLSVNGAPPKTYPVGATLPDGSKLIAVSSGEAVIAEGSKRYTIRLGEFVTVSAGGGNTMVLTPDQLGHYSVQGEINGVPVRMLLDTGASYVSIPAAMAAKMGIDYRGKGRRGQSSTANGVTEVWLVKLDRVRIGGFEFANVEASVSEAPLPVILLGNSVLKRLDMKTESGTLTLSKRF